jgi:Ca-activated chloride channel family protein
MGPGETPKAAVARIHERIASPALADLEIDWGSLGVRDVVPAKIPDVFVGQSVVVFGRFSGEASGEIVLKGRRGERRVEVPIRIDVAKAERSDGLASTWARQTIGDLTMDPRALTEDEPARKVREEKVVELALAHRVMTQYTSFVAIDEMKRAAPGEAATVAVPVEVPAGVEMDAWGMMAGTEIGEAYGVGGLGLVGTGRGGGGTGSGYGRGSAGGTSMHGRVPRVRMAKAVVTGSIDKDIIRRIVRAHVGEVRKCYDDGLKRDPNLKGRVLIAFTIGKSGKVVAATVESTTVADAAVGECIAKAAGRWKFPKNEIGDVTIKYPFVLEAG